MTDRIVVFSACGSEEEAERLGRMLVERRLAACVNILPQIHSIYRWKGEVEDACESLLMIKTTQAHFPDIRDVLRQQHSYELPEVIAMPVADGLPEYLAWMGAA